MSASWISNMAACMIVHRDILNKFGVKKLKLFQMQT